MNGRDKWEAMRAKLHGGGDHWTEDLRDLSFEVLKEKEAKIGKWLGEEENKKHKDFGHLKRRYDAICLLITEQEAQGALF